MVAKKMSVKVEKKPVKTVKASVKAAAPLAKMVTKKEPAEKALVPKVSVGYKKVQTAEGWKRMIKKERGMR
jgi:hypothetical protein